MVAAADWVLVDSNQIQSLVDLPEGIRVAVASVENLADMNVARRLAEIGFLPGETLHVVARVPGGDPIAVRIGSSTFALRRHEAGCIRVCMADTQ